MDRKRLGGLVAAAGAVLIALSALADPLGLGEGEFGWKQVVGVVVGALVAAAGLALAFWRRGEARAPEPST
ncbi:MAG TPA: hypothetical protein VNJ53_02265 [Gaiellaceae bacterium]|nr:hypothetical protein [Gaiellaceae bacterium]